MIDYAIRLLSACQELAVEYNLHGKIALAALLLKRSFSTSMWTSADGMLGQLPGVGIKTTGKLKEAGVVSFRDVMSESVGVLEKAAGRKSPFGTELQSTVAKLLAESLLVVVTLDAAKNAFTCSVTDAEPVTRAEELEREGGQGGEGRGGGGGGGRGRQRKAE